MGKRIFFKLPRSNPQAAFLHSGAAMFWFHPSRYIMSALTDLQDAVSKLQGDVSAKLTAKDAQIADLTAQLAAATAAAQDGPALVDLTAQVAAIDATVSA